MSSDKDRKWARKKLLKETGREPTSNEIEARIAQRSVTLPPIDLKDKRTMPVPVRAKTSAKRFVTTNKVFDYDALAGDLRKSLDSPPSIELSPLRGMEILLEALIIRQSGDTDAFVHEYRLMAHAVQLLAAPYLSMLPKEIQQSLLTMSTNHGDEAMDMLGGKESRLLVASRQDLNAEGERPRLDRSISQHPQRYWSAVQWFLIAVDCRECAGLTIPKAIEEAVEAVEKRAGTKLSNILPGDASRERAGGDTANGPEKGMPALTMTAIVKRFSKYRLAFRNWRAEDAIPTYPILVYNAQRRVTAACTEAERKQRFDEAIGHAAEGFKAANDPPDKRIRERK